MGRRTDDLPLVSNERGFPLHILFIASIAIITSDPQRDRALFVDTLGLPLEGDDDYIFSEQIGGSKHFGVWPLTQAAEACFGRKEWPSDKAIPQASVEFEVADEQSVTDAAKELEAKGYALLHAPRQEPWGQSVARILTPDGLIIGISYAPSLH